MVNWCAEDVIIFKQEAQTLQQEYCDLLGDREWDVIEKGGFEILHRKVGFGIFGPPIIESGIGYDKEQLNIIEKVSSKLVDDSGRNLKIHNIHFACIFVIMKVHNKSHMVPVFKARCVLGSLQGVFVDTSARTYSDWNDYLKHNTLEKCIYCYPTWGKYETNNNNEVYVSFNTSPACSDANKVLRFVDSVATGAAICATAVGVAALLTIPIAGPILTATTFAGAATGGYGVARSSYTLYDRANHKESIALYDDEAKWCWLNIAGSSLFFLQGRMVASMSNGARSGEVMSKAGRIAFNIVQTGNLAVNATSIVLSLAVMVDKTERDELTTLDVFQFTASVLFFSNTVMNCKTATTIIKEVQHDVINSHRDPLSRNAKQSFDRQTKKLLAQDDIHSNANAVKQLNRIGNSKELYELMVNSNVRSRNVELTENGFKGMLDINKNIKIHPLKLLEIPETSRKAIFEVTNKYMKGSISKTEFHSQMKTYSSENRINFESMRRDTLQKLCLMYGKENVRDITVGDRKIFADADPHEIDRLRVLLENTAQHDQNFLDVATEFAKSRGCNSAKEFITYAEYVAADLNETVKIYESLYQRDLAEAKTRPDFNQLKYDEECLGIRPGMKRSKLFKQKALNEFKNSDGYEKLNRRYEHIRSCVAPENQKCETGFFSDDDATYHYLKHMDFGKHGQLTPKEYFECAERVVGNPINKTNATLSQDGSCAIITYFEPEMGVKVIKIDRQGQSGIASVMYVGSQKK